MKRIIVWTLAIFLLLFAVAYASGDKEPTIPIYYGSTDEVNGGSWISQIQARLYMKGYFEGQFYHPGIVDDATNAALQRYYIAMGKYFDPNGQIGVDTQKQILNDDMVQWTNNEQLTTATPSPTPFPVFRLGDSGNEIVQIQQLLSEAGYFELAGTKCMPGVLDEGTMKALEAYMNMWSYTFTGVVDGNIYSIIAGKGTSMPTPKVTPSPTPSPVPTVFVGFGEQNSELIKEIQVRLEALGYLKSDSYSIGVYDVALQDALYDFCFTNKVTVDDGGINQIMYSAILSPGAIAKPKQSIFVGDISDDIEQLQKSLYALHCYDGLERSGNVCDSVMMQAVARFAEANSITFDGSEITAAIQNDILSDKSSPWIAPEPEKINWFKQKSVMLGMNIPRYAIVIIFMIIAVGLAVLLINTFSNKEKTADVGVPARSIGGKGGLRVELQVTYHGQILGRYNQNISTPVHIGRGFNAIPLDPSDLSVSKNHCQLSYHDNTLYLRDFSRNGTRVNGISVHNGENVVCNNAEIEVGSHIIKVTIL